MRTIRNGAAGALAALVLAGLTGCGKDSISREVAAMNTSNIQRLANVYSAFQNYKGGRGPKDEAELKTFIREFDPSKLEMMGISASNVDVLFTSDRDGKPFRIRYKVGGGRGSVSAVIFEQEGKDGTKQVAYTGNSKVEDVDATTYQRLLAGKGPSEPPAAPPTRRPGSGGRPGGGPPPGAPTGPGGSVGQ
jgi:hypothetical protein